MDIEFHRSVVQLGPGNYLQWKSGILDHCIMYNLLPHLLGLAPEPIDRIRHQNLLNENDMTYGLLCLTTPEDLQRRLEFTESAHKAWIFIRNFHGDFDPPSSGYGSSDDLASMEESEFTDTFSYEGQPTHISVHAPSELSIAPIIVSSDSPPQDSLVEFSHVHHIALDLRFSPSRASTDLVDSSLEILPSPVASRDFEIASSKGSYNPPQQDIDFFDSDLDDMLEDTDITVQHLLQPTASSEIRVAIPPASTDSPLQQVHLPLQGSLDDISIFADSHLMEIDRIVTTSLDILSPSHIGPPSSTLHVPPPSDH
ncbi:hypothetical protein KI387_012506 [Taxus chinensis]|uniref:Uncharacterized protein n=1 Tax=Taxus chinensis TaxID=29808 RepID=A0AA38FG07_TAXCH|nr:hypothetical protein KI387_012506 [Taxus chinensis]